MIVCREFTRAQINELFDNLIKEAEHFYEENKINPRDVNVIYINWIGFCLRPELHSFINQLNFSKEISIERFSLTKSGEPIVLSELALQLCKIN